MELFEYKGRVYVRPVSRGIVLLEDQMVRQLEDIVKSGYYYMEVTIRKGEEGNDRGK